jgi:thiamine-monophosphate kinase
MPRVEFGQQLAATPGVHAMMDISDGIASDLHHILNASSSCPDADWARSRFNPDTLPGNMHSTPFYGTSPGKVPASKLDLAQVPMDNDRLCALSAEIDLKALPMSEELKTVCAERGWDATELAVSGGEDYELLFTVAPGTELPEGCTVIGRIVDSRSEPGMRCEDLGMTGGMSEPGIRWIGSDKDFKGFTHF